MLQFRPGDIFFCINHSNPISKGIAFFSRSKVRPENAWSHCGFVYDIGRKVYTLETNDFNVGFQHIGEYLKNPNVTIEVWRMKDLSTLQAAAVVERAFQLYKDRYGYEQLLSYMIQVLLERIKVRIKNFWTAGTICSELVLTGLFPLYKIDPGNTNLAKTYDTLTTRPQATLLLRKERGETVK
jgi:hypothetical protein